MGQAPGWGLKATQDTSRVLSTQPHCHPAPDISVVHPPWGAELIQSFKPIYLSIYLGAHIMHTFLSGDFLIRCIYAAFTSPLESGLVSFFTSPLLTDVSDFSLL